MNLIVDIGNSFVKVAVMNGNEMLWFDRYASVDSLDFSAIKGRWPQLQRAIVASTAIDTAVIAASLRDMGLWVVEMNSSTHVPIGNRYATPETLGVDRLAAAVAAVDVLGCRDCVIVDFGSAITIDFVSDGVYCGGNISPGVEMRFRALHDYTKRLPKCRATNEVLDMGRTTVQAIEQGVMQGITNEIIGYIDAINNKNAKISIIFAGGDAIFFDKRIKNAIFAKCDLVITGLNRILDYNASIKQENN